MTLMACRECDALSRVALAVAATFRCPRCHAVLHRGVPRGLDTSLALSIAAAILFAIANVFPIVAIEAAGNRTHATLIGAAIALHAEQMNLVALLVLLTTVAVPTTEILCTASLLILAKNRRASHRLGGIFRLREILKPWSMVEIFVLGALVAITRLGSLASVIVGIGFWSLVASMLLSAASSHAFDPQELWNEAEALS